MEQHVRLRKWSCLTGAKGIGFAVIRHNGMTSNRKMAPAYTIVEKKKGVHQTMVGYTL